MPPYHDEPLDKARGGGSGALRYLWNEGPGCYWLSRSSISLVLVVVVVAVSTLSKWESQ